MIKQIQFQNNYDAAKDANRTGAYVALRYDTEKKTLSVIDKFGEQKTNIIAADANEDRNIQKLKEQVVQLINKDDNFKQFLLQTVKETQSIKQEEKQKEEYTNTPLTFKSFGSNNYIRLYNYTSSLSQNYIHYKINNGEWQYYKNNTKIDLQDGDTVSFKGRIFNQSFNADDPLNSIALKFATSSYKEPTPSTPTKPGIEGCYFKVYGNINSIERYQKRYYGMFMNCNAIVDASQLILPKEINTYGFNGMFQGCTNLKYAPQISLNLIPIWGCTNMFNGCKNLENISLLKAISIYKYGCQNMFAGCKSLITLKIDSLNFYEGSLNGIIDSSGIKTLELSLHSWFSPIEESNYIPFQIGLNSLPSTLETIIKPSDLPLNTALLNRLKSGCKIYNKTPNGLEQVIDEDILPHE